MIWAQRRKLAYMSGLLSFLLVVGLVVFLTSVERTPTCFDNKKNGSETGIDCGGVCLNYCPDELSDPKIRWVRSFEISPGVVHSVAYIEHNNNFSASERVGYTFKLYDDKGSLVTERAGFTYIGPMGRSAIVENLIQVGNSDIATTTFEFLKPIRWKKIDNTFSRVVIKSDRNLLEGLDMDGVRLTSMLENTSRYSFKDLDIVAIVYDKSDNAVLVSKSLLKDLPALSDQTLYFTWPQVLKKEDVSKIEIIPRINPFDVESL